MGSRCEGHCCESFTISKDLVWRLLTNDFEGHANPEEDSYKVIRMLKTTDIIPEAKSEGISHEGVMYFTCKKYDPETKSCTDYENRPNMCRRYPDKGGCNYKNCCWDKVNGTEVQQTKDLVCIQK